jgi:hypothetical protein
MVIASDDADPEVPRIVAIEADANARGCFPAASSHIATS